MLTSNLKLILDSRDIKIRQAARDIDYRFESVRSLYNDELERYPRELLYKICIYLDITLDDLFSLDR
jgi:DNA-binding Xre family transcriptional regulator